MFCVLRKQAALLCQGLVTIFFDQSVIFLFILKPTNGNAANTHQRMNNEVQFMELIAQHRGIILKLTSLYAADANDRADLYQDVLMQAWRAFPSFRGDAKFSTWLYRVCLNTLLSARRKKELATSEMTPMAENLAADAPAGRSEDAQRLHSAIRMLAPTDKAIVSLHLDGYDNGEIAALMGITTNNAGVKLHRIKNQLASMLKNM
jgi:RNA polymerase sigma-70 factor (ECF subfamily)